MAFLRKNKNPIFIITILILSLITHFIFWGYPSETVFDEVHFGKFASGYLTQEYFFDIHPPLGKLLITATGNLGGYSNNFNFENIGDKYPDSSYVWLRLVPIIAGTLLPLIIYFLARKLKISEILSFVAATLVILENSLLVQSRFILLDSMLLFFGFLGLFLYFTAKENKSYLFFIASGISLGACASIKWTGLSFIALIVVWEILIYVYRLIKKKKVKPSLLAIKLSVILVTFFVVYFATFAVHFTVLKKSGPGNGYMSKSFQKTLEGSSYQDNSDIKASNIFSKFTELNIEMFDSNQRINTEHPYQSKWYTWPIMARPIYYWNSQDEGEIGRIYLLGNPFIYWAAFFAIMVTIINSFLRKEWRTKKEKIVIFLILGYLINLLPFIFIKRPMFLYHYLAALIFGILALVYLIDRIKNNKIKKTIIAALIIIALATFIYLAPLSYGLPITENEFINRIWFPAWQ